MSANNYLKYFPVLSFIPIFFLLISDITFQQEINHAYNWGRNQDRELGILLPDTNIYTPKHLPNIESQLKSIDSTGFYNDSKIQIFQGMKFTYFSSNSFDNSTKKFQNYSILLGCGYNGDKYLGLYTPITISNPTLPFRYTEGGADNDYRTIGTTMYGKSVKEMSCLFSCLIVANDNLVYLHKYGDETLDYSLEQNLPKTMLHPDLDVTVQLNYTKVVVCGNALNQETFFVTTDSGFLFVWGNPNGGKRGDGSLSYDLVLHPLRNVTDISCGNLQNNVAVIAVTSDNKVFYWGSMSPLFSWPNDQLLVDTPTLLDISVITGDSDRVIKVKHSGNHALLLTEKGMVYSFGADDNGQVTGVSGGSNVKTLFNITQSIAGGYKRIKEIYVGGATSSGALTEDNLLYTWGAGYGRGRASNGGSSPQLVGLPEDDNKVLYASISNDFGFILTTNRKVYGFGNNEDSMVCDGSLKIASSPMKLTNDSDNSVIDFKNHSENKTAIQIVSGGSHTLLLLGDGSLYIWGRCFSRMSTILDGNQDVYLPATLLPSSLFNGERIISVDSKNVHIAVLTSNGNVYTWGDATNYKLGNSNNQGAIGTPIKVDLPLPANAIAVGAEYTLILLTNGNLIGVGSNTKGQLGLGTDNTVESEFKPASNIQTITSEGDEIIQIACTSSTSYIVTRSGKLYSAGDNTGGIANGDEQPSTINYFTQVTGIPSRVTKIITGAVGSALIITVDGKAYKLMNPISEIRPATADSSDQFIVNGAISYSNAFIITSKKRLYGGGSNNAFQITTNSIQNDYPLNNPLQEYAMTVNFGGEMPHLISITSGFSGATSIQLVTVKEYQCFGKNSSDYSKVCNGNGCQCNQGYFGDKCQLVSCYGNEEKFGYTNRLCLKINNVLLNNY
ncbi:hypothetical protein ABK040_005637 [Willaertia magna]